MVAHAFNSTTIKTEAACLPSAWAIQQDPVVKSKTENNDKIASSDTLQKRRCSKDRGMSSRLRLHILEMLEGVF